MHVSLFSLLGASRLETVRAQAGAAVAAWSAQWGVAAASLECQRADPSLAGVAWDERWHAGARGLWLARAAGLQEALQRAMFGDNPIQPLRAGAPPHLAPLAAARAMDALGTALASLLGEEDGHGARRGMAEQPGSRTLSGSAGTLLLTVRVGAASCRCLLDAASVERLAPASAPKGAPLAPVDRLKALKATPLRLAVRLGQAEVGLSALMSVAVGDVIRLDCPVDAPVAVLGPSGEPLLRAYLGQAQGAVAVEVDSCH